MLEDLAEGEPITEEAQTLAYEKATLAELAKLRSEEARVLAIRERLARLREIEQQDRSAMQEAYLNEHAARFAGFEWKRALIGAPVTHTFTIPDAASYVVRPPSTGRSRRVRSFAQTEGTLTDSQRVLLEWLDSVQLQDQNPSQLYDLPEAKRLALIDQLPEILVNKIADECTHLATWMAIHMEQNLGNS